MIKLWSENEIPLYEENIENNCIPSIAPYIKEGAKSCVLVCPGGGYTMKASDHEGFQVAEFLNSINVSAFVLDYRVAPYKFPCCLLDAKRAIRYIRKNADKYGYDEDKIGILGFSAGGHLAATVSTSTEDEASEYNVGDEIDKVSAKVNFSILCYPVTVYSDFSHYGSFKALCGTDDKLKFSLSLEKRVTPDTPKTFIWATSNDNCVPVSNTILYTQKLAENNVEFESHIFRNGFHGLGLADKDPRLNKAVAVWPSLLKTWLKDTGFIG